MNRPAALARILLIALLGIITLGSIALAQRRSEHRPMWDSIQDALEQADFALTGCGNAYNDVWAVCSRTDAPLDEIDERIETFWTALGIDLSSWGERPFAIGDSIVWKVEGGELRTELEDLADGTPWVQVFYSPTEEFPAPANDNYGGATPVQGASGSTTGTNRGAWTYRGEPDYFYDPDKDDLGAAGVWWTWTAPDSGTYAFDTSGSSFDTLLHVYTAVNDLDYYPEVALISRNDDAAALGLQSRVTFDAIAGTTYHIRVGGFDGATGDITLNWSRRTAASGAGSPDPAGPSIGERPTLDDELLLQAFREYWDFKYRWPDAGWWPLYQREMEGGEVVDYKINFGGSMSAPSETCRDVDFATFNGIPVPAGIDPANAPEMREWYHANDLVPIPTYSTLENVVIAQTRLEARSPETGVRALYPGYTFSFEAPIRAQAFTAHRDTCAIEVELIPQRVFIEGEAVFIDGFWAIELESPLGAKDEIVFAEGTY